MTSPEIDQHDLEQRDLEALIEGRIADLAAKVGPRFKDASLATFRTDHAGSALALAEVCAWLDGPGNVGLMLIGPTSVGKTHLLYGIGVEMLRRWRNVAWVHVPSWLERRKRAIGDGGGSITPEQFARLCDVYLLDELGLDEAPSSWDKKQLYMLIDSLWRGCKTVCATSNLSYGELSAQWDERMVSRLVDLTDKVDVDGLNYRVERHRRRAS